MTTPMLSPHPFGASAPAAALRTSALRMALLPFAALAVFFLFGCGQEPTTTERLGLEEPATVEGFELERYVGSWYEIGNFPMAVQEGCTGTVATYTVRDDDQVDVFNRCFQDSLEGDLNEANGLARAVDLSAGQFEVSFFQPFWGAYWVLELGELNNDGDYSYSVVGHPSRDFLWILSRTPQMDQTQLDGILDRLETVHQYELDRFVYTPQPEG